MNKVDISRYNPGWTNEFEAIAAELATLDLLKDAAVYHIGSTSIYGLDAKDVIDVQVVVPSLHEFDVSSSELSRLSYTYKPGLTDHIPAGVTHEDSEWAKYFCVRADDDRIRVNLHVRQKGSLNTRFALLFRDYLRSNQQVSASYAALKRTLASKVGAEDYPIIKDPVIDIIMIAAETWAKNTDWQIPTH